MDLPPPTDWPASVEVAGDVVTLRTASQVLRHDAVDGFTWVSRGAEARLAGQGGTWSCGPNAEVIWTPDGGAPVTWTAAGEPADASVQGDRLWIVSPAGLQSVTPAGISGVLDPAAVAVSVHGERRAVASAEQVAVYGPDDRRICAFDDHIGAPQRGALALSAQWIAVSYEDGLALLDPSTCALLRVGRPAGAILGLSGDRLWVGRDDYVSAWRLPDLEVTAQYPRAEVNAVLAGPNGPVLWSGSEVYDGATGRWTPVGAGAVLARGPDRLVNREGGDLVVRDAAGTVLSRTPAPRLAPLIAAVNVDGDLAVTDGLVVMRVGKVNQEVVLGDRVMSLGRGPGGAVRVRTNPAGPWRHIDDATPRRSAAFVPLPDRPQVWELRPGAEPVRVSGLALRDLETRGEQAAAVTRLSPSGGRYSVILRGEHMAVWDQDTLRVVGAPLPLVSVAAVSPDGRWVAAVEGETLLIVETATGKVLRRVAGMPAAPTLALGPRQVVLESREGWTVVDPVSGTVLRLPAIDASTRIKLADQRLRWAAWKVSGAPSSAAPAPGEVPADPIAVAIALSALPDVTPGDPLCTDATALATWRSLARSPDSDGLTERLARRCSPPAAAAPEAAGQLTLGEARPDPADPPPADLRVTDLLTGEILRLPLRVGRPTLVLRDHWPSKQDLDRRLPSGVDVLLLRKTGDTPFGEGWQLEGKDPGARQVAILGDRNAEQAPPWLFGAEATLIGPGGRVLGRGELDPVLEAAAWWHAAADRADVPEHSGHLAWTWQGHSRIDATLAADGQVLLNDGDHLVALGVEGQLLWTRELRGYAALQDLGPLVLYNEERSTRLSAADGTPVWSVAGAITEGSDASLCLARGAALVDAETGQITVGSAGGPDPWPCGRYTSPFRGKTCLYQVDARVPATCRSAPPAWPVVVPFGELSLINDGERVVARHPLQGEVWAMAGARVLPFGDARVLVQLERSFEGGELWEGPWVAVDAYGRSRERLGLGQAVVLDGKVILTHGETVTAWELP